MEICFCKNNQIWLSRVRTVTMETDSSLITKLYTVSLYIGGGGGGDSAKNTRKQFTKRGRQRTKNNSLKGGLGGSSQILSNVEILWLILQTYISN